MSTKKISKRRDSSPARASADGRVSYWTGGKAGAGERKQFRAGDYEAAEVWAAAYNLAAETEDGDSDLPRVLMSLDDMFRDFIEHLRKSGKPQGTINQYRSNWNKWVPESIGKVPCGLAKLQHFTAIFNGITEDQSTRLGTVRGVARTVGAAITWGVRNGYFGDANPFATPDHRRAVVKDAVTTVRPRSDAEQHYDNEDCPTPEDVDILAAAVELEYPGYGARLVYLAFATGLRINECLALRWDSIDALDGLVCVDWQMDRYKPWPARRLPKGNKTRTTRVWRGEYLELARSLILDALQRPGTQDGGWLFPRRDIKVKWWSDSVSKFIGKAIEQSSWDWTFHWLRHGFASWCLTAKEAGGFGIDVLIVQKWLGHSRPSVTRDMYQEQHKGGDEDAWKGTGRPGKRNQAA